LVIDEARLPVPVTWEPGDPPTPDGLVFPHLYAPLPARAVVAAVPYLPLSDGMFGRPVGLPEPDDHLHRAYALEWYLSRAGGAGVGRLGNAFDDHHPDDSGSDQHNRLVIRPDQTPVEAAAMCAQELGEEHWQVHVQGPMAPRMIMDYQAAGWSHTEQLLMVAADVPSRVDVSDVEVSEVASAASVEFTASLEAYIPRLMDPELRQLVEREAITGGVAMHLHLAVLDDAGSPLSEADVLIAGATAQLDNVITIPDRRGRGYATAVIVDSVARARHLGCDVIFLRTAADERIRETYERLGFRTIGTAHVFDRAATSG
jgi:predicted GNAT family acetyltransferase